MLFFIKFRETIFCLFVFMVCFYGVSGADPRVSANCRLQATSRIYAQNSLTNINYGKRKVLTPYLPETSVQNCLGRDGDDSMASRLVTTPPNKR